MCGIAGIFAYANEAPVVDDAELLRIRERMIRRGPDGAGLWIDEQKRIGLAHRRLSIIDLSEAGAQPMRDPATGNWIVFNGEIYNFRELRSELEAAGQRFASHSDTEVLLKLYASVGEKMVDRLRGMFAFAIWDSAERRLFLARDPFGIKPLYFADDGKTFRFASQVKALLASDRISREPEPAGHVGFFLWGSVPEPFTLYSSIRSLPAGHTMTVGSRGVERTAAYAVISDIFANALDSPAQGSRNDAIDAIVEALKDSVRAHRVADVPVGVFLSAGLDSSVLAALSSASRLTETRGVTLSFAEYAGTENDEAPLAAKVAADLRIGHSTYRVTREDFLQSRAALMEDMDQPSIDGVNTWLVARAAAQGGLKVVLSGLGGDETLASYPGFKRIPALVRFAWPARTLPGFGKFLRVLTAPLCSRYTSPKLAGVIEYGTNAPDAYLLLRCLYAPWEAVIKLDSRFKQLGLQSLGAAGAVHDSLGLLRRKDSCRSGRGFSRAEWRFVVSALEINWYLRNQLLRDADWAGMAHSLEIRTPFVDVYFIERVAGIIASYPGITKREIVERAAPQLPAAVLGRSKTGFAVPVQEWSMRSERDTARGIREWANEVYLAATMTT